MKITTKITTVGIDLAKNVFSMHGINEHGKAVLKRTVSRGKVMEVMAAIPPCLVGVEACSGAHHWARELGRLGHTVRIMAPRFVAPYRKSGKNDGNDAEAICEAVGRPSMRFVALQSVEQQSLLVVHRVRACPMNARPASINCAACCPNSASSSPKGATRRATNCRWCLMMRTTASRNWRARCCRK